MKNAKCFKMNLETIIWVNSKEKLAFNIWLPLKSENNSGFVSDSYFWSQASNFSIL